MLTEYFSFSPSLVVSAIALATVFYVAQAIHRAFFSPLATIPGPLLNKFSNLPLQYHLIRGQCHSYTTKLHAKYGEVVRIGYDHVSLSNTADCRTVLATHAFTKGQMYDKGYSGEGFEVNTFNAVHPDVNKLRRRMIGDAFAMHTMRAVEDLVLDAGANSLIKTWDSEIAKQGMVARINYHDSFNRMGFDIIGRLGFGRNFNVLQTGNTEVINWMSDSVTFAALRGMAPWLARQPWAFKGLKQSRKKVELMADETFEARQRLISETGAPQRVDLLQKLVDAKDPETGLKFTPSQVQSEIILMLTAGSDTTSNMLAWIVTNLMNYPDVYKRVVKEVRSAFPDTSKPISFAEAKSTLPYLSAVIHESMRLTPSFSGIMQRRVPAEGASFQGHFIPNTAHVCVAVAACHHNPRLWIDPEVFDPERFMGPGSAEKTKNILMFSSGVRICIGKNLAWLELYTVLANILRRYEFSLPKDAPYGPHRLGKSGLPAEVPAESFLVSSPVYPQDNCCVNIAFA